jgi:hypothetical protein
MRAITDKTQIENEGEVKLKRGVIGLLLQLEMDTPRSKQWSFPGRNWRAKCREEKIFYLCHLSYF